MKTLTVIIPVYNEEKTIQNVLKNVYSSDLGSWIKEVIVVDDASTDKSLEILKDFKKIYNFTLISLTANQGKGTAIRTALEKSTGLAVCVQDADLEYDPQEYKKLLQLYDAGHPAVYGSRNLNPQRKGYFYYVIGAKIIDGMANYLFNSKITDTYTCYKLINAKLLKSLNLQSRGFEIEAEITAKLLKKRIAIREVAINYLPRKFHQGKKIRAFDGLKGIWTLISCKLK